MGEMRSFWKGTTELEDTTYATRRHLGTQQTSQQHDAALVSSTKTVAQAEHGRRDSPWTVLSHSEDADEKGSFGLARIIQRVHHPPRRPLLCHGTSKCCCLKQQTQAVNDRIPAKGCRHLLVKPWANGTGKRTMCQLCGAIINDNGEIPGTRKSIQRRLVTAETPLHSNRKASGRTELDLVQDEIHEAKRLLGVKRVVRHCLCNHGFVRGDRSK